MSNQWDEYFHLWRWEGCSAEHPSGIHCDDFPLYETPAAKELLMQRAQGYRTLPSISSFIRAFAELKREAAIKPVRQRDPIKIDDSERALTAELYFKMPAAEVRRRFANEPDFRSQVQHLLAIGAI